MVSNIKMQEELLTCGHFSCIPTAGVLHMNRTKFMEESRSVAVMRSLDFV